jgi:hypothetical protein
MAVSDADLHFWVTAPTLGSTVTELRGRGQRPAIARAREIVAVLKRCQSRRSAISAGADGSGSPALTLIGWLSSGLCATSTTRQQGLDLWKRSAPSRTSILHGRAGSDGSPWRQTCDGRARVEGRKCDGYVTAGGVVDRKLVECATRVRPRGGTAELSWWSRTGSNRRPLECHSSALPAELRPHQGSDTLAKGLPSVNERAGP